MGGECVGMAPVAEADGVWHSVGMDSLLTRITIDPAIYHGKPCVRGLRYPVETLLELLSSGTTFDEILADYEDQAHDRVAHSATEHWKS